MFVQTVSDFVDRRLQDNGDALSYKDLFRPDRWLEGEEQVRKIEKVDLGWGAGRRTYIGKSVFACPRSSLIVC